MPNHLTFVRLSVFQLTYFTEKVVGMKYTQFIYLLFLLLLLFIIIWPLSKGHRLLLLLLLLLY